MPKSLTMPEKIAIVNDFTSSAFVRHPFVRVVSAFIDKIIDNDYRNWRELVNYHKEHKIKVNFRHVARKEYKEEAQCAQKGGRMLFFVICGFIKHFFPNLYFILQIHHVKSFKRMHVTSLYFYFSLRFS